MQWLAFFGVLLIGAMSPGPDFVVVTRNSIVSGRRAGVATALGIGAGVFGWTVAVALGVAGVLAASAEVFTVLRLLGAGYLVYLGVRSWIAARHGAYGELGSGPAAMVRTSTALRQGVLTNLLNPKVAVFYLALLPQFLPPGASAERTLLLAVGATAVTAAWFTVLAVVIGGLRRAFASVKVRRMLDTVLGAVLVGLGVRVALQP